MYAEYSAVVIDNGSFECKAGFSDEDAPRCCFPSIVGRPKSMIDQNAKVQVGDMAFCRRGFLKLISPINNGMIVNWDEMERIWHHALLNELRLCPEEQRPLFITEAAMNYKSTREKTISIFFENFNVPQIFIGNQSVMSLFASGRITGAVVNSGNDITSTFPFMMEHALQYTIQQSPIAGQECTDRLIQILGQPGMSFSTIAERKIVRDIKEKVTYVALDYEAELYKYKESAANNIQYELPDGNILVIQNQRFKCPEILFKPNLIGMEVPGIHELTFKCIMKWDIEVGKALYGNIVMSGGTTMFPGISERLSKEVTALAPTSMKIKVVAPPERKFSAWIGGSILSSLSTFQAKWITRADYDEYGASIVHRKYF